MLILYSTNLTLLKYKVSQKKVGFTTCNSSSKSHFFGGHLVVFFYFIFNSSNKEKFEKTNKNKLERTVMKKDNKTHVGVLLSMEKVHGLKKKISDQVQNKVDMKSFKNLSKVSINLMFLYLN